MTAPQPPSEPSVAREIARNVGRTALESATVQQAIGGVLLLGLMVIFVPLGLLVLIVAAVPFALVFGALGSMLGDGADAILGFAGLAYWIGALVVMFLLFRKTYRWLARRSSAVQNATEVAFGGRRPGDADDSTMVARAAPNTRSATNAGARAPSLAELDARLAPPEPPQPSA